MLPLSKTINVLVVDDEPALREMLRASFAAGGLDVQEPSADSNAVGAVEQKTSEIVLVDINGSGVSGVEMCRQIRAFSPGAGIVMVAARDSEETKAQVLKDGANDYVIKPCQWQDLAAGLEAGLQRAHARPNASGVLQVGDLKLELEGHLLWKRGRQIRLSPKESDLLACLMRNPGAPMSHVMLLRAVWGHEYGSEIEYLGSYIRTLRKKIEDDPARPAYILTEDWVGYRFRDPADPVQPAWHAEDSQRCDVAP